MTQSILLSPPDTGPTEEAAVLRALRSGWIAPLGPEVDAFESEMAEYTGRKHAVALSSGTAALHLALLNFGVGPGDSVLTATMTFAATANAVMYTGAEPIFVDSDATGNMDPGLLEHALAELQAQGKSVAAVVPVDLLGKIADYPRIAESAARYGVPVIADSAESLGAWREGRQAGSYGDAAILSFNGNKVMTTSGGGMLLTDDPDLAARTRYLATQARQAVVHYEHTEVGYNYRLSNILAAVGRAQLSRLDSMIDRRQQHRRRYSELFGSIPGTEIFQSADGFESGQTRDNFWLTSVLVDPDITGWTAAELVSHLAKYDIESRPLWKPMHLQPVFADHASFLSGMSERLFRTGLSLPSGSALSEDAIDRVCAAIVEFCRVGGDE